MQTYKQFMKAKMYPDPNDTSVDSHIDLSGKPAQSTNNFEKEQGI